MQVAQSRVNLVHERTKEGSKMIILDATGPWPATGPDIITARAAEWLAANGYTKTTEKSENK